MLLKGIDAILQNAHSMYLIDTNPLFKVSKNTSHFLEDIGPMFNTPRKLKMDIHICQVSILPKNFTIFDLLNFEILQNSFFENMWLDFSWID